MAAAPEAVLAPVRSTPGQDRFTRPRHGAKTYPGEGNMTNEERARLEQQRADAFNTMQRLVGAGDMNADQRREFDAAEAEFDRLDDVLQRAARIQNRNRSGIGATPAAPAARSTTPGEVRMDGPYLARESRMADWAAQRGAVSDEAEGFRLGAAVRGIVTGDWDGAEDERRALSSGASATGGVLVPQLVSAQVIDALTDRATVLQAGARVVPMGSETQKLPKIESLPTPGWRGQNDPVAEDEPGFDALTLTAKTLAVLCRIPWELFEDVSAEASQAITDALVTSLSLELDRAAYFADGTAKAPTGLVHTAGVNIAPVATNGAAPEDYSALTSALFAVRRRNAAPNAAVYSERTAEAFAGLTDSTGQPLRAPQAVEALDQFSTNAVPDDETVGTGEDASSIIVGQFDQLALGFRPSLGFRVVSSQTAGMENMQALVVAYLRADVGVIRPEAFEVRSGILAA